MSEFADKRNKTARRDGYMSCADVTAPRGSKDVNSFEKVLEISERLSHAHEDNVVNVDIFGRFN